MLIYQMLTLNQNCISKIDASAFIDLNVNVQLQQVKLLLNIRASDEKIMRSGIWLLLMTGWCYTRSLSKNSSVSWWSSQPSISSLRFTWSYYELKDGRSSLRSVLHAPLLMSVNKIHFRCCWDFKTESALVIVKLCFHENEIRQRSQTRPCCSLISDTGALLV